MKIYEITFSPTGGTKKVADILAAALHGDITSVDLTDSSIDYSNIAPEQDDAAVIAVPSYGGRVPEIAVERLLKIKAYGSKAILICVYGNRAYEDTLTELFDAANSAGFNVIAAVAAVAEHSIARQFATGRPDGSDEEQLCGFAEKIRSKLLSGDVSNPEIPGNRPYKKRGGKSAPPMPNGKCVKCGLCARKCPVQAINKNDPQSVDGEKCISCMRCIVVCPRSAREISAERLAAVGNALKDVCSVRKENAFYI